MTNRIFILGAADPEMSAIASLLALAGEQATNATSHGVRVTPASANKADAVENSAALASATDVVLVECRLPVALLEGKSVVVCDHHAPGDPGFGRPAAEYWEASSLGQVWNLITYEDAEGRWLSTNEWPETMPPLQLVAAADHCLRAAYQGLCPGVDSTVLAVWRDESRAAFQKRPVADIVRDVEEARVVVRAAARIDLGDGILVADLRHRHVPELPEAGAQEGVGYLARVQERPTPGKTVGRWKVVVSGEAPEVEAFLRWAPSQGLTDLYGDPVRGFAGGYESPNS